MRYKGYSDDESNEMHRIFKSGSSEELDGLLAKLKGKPPLERDTSVPAYSGPLFHGTSDPGVAERGKVLPARQFGGDSYHKPPDGSMQQPGDYAFATEHERTAWGYADSAADKTGDRAYVVSVHPKLQMEKGVYHDTNREWRADQFDVSERHDTMPGQQGTIPQVNWNTYKDPKTASRWEDANHPRPDDVEWHTRPERRHEFEDSARGHHAGQTRLF